MEKTKRGCSSSGCMQVKVEVVGGRHICTAKEKGTLFVRYHAEGVPLSFNTKQVPAAAHPHWAEAISIECTASQVDPLSHLRSHSLVFQLRWRSEGLWGDLRGSQRIGSVKIAWTELLESKSLCMEDWFPLAGKGGLKDGHKPPALRLALSVTPLPPRVERGRICQRNGNALNSFLDREECGCGGNTWEYQGAMSSGEAA